MLAGYFCYEVMYHLANVIHGLDYLHEWIITFIYSIITHLAKLKGKNKPNIFCFISKLLQDEEMVYFFHNYKCSSLLK